MKALGLYSAASIAVVASVTAGFWVFLSVAGRQSMITAGLIALPLQVAFFALLLRAQGQPKKFMVWWGAGTLGRMIVVAIAGLAGTRVAAVEPGVFLMSLIGFFFGLLLLEPLFLDHGQQTATLAQ